MEGLTPNAARFRLVRNVNADVQDANDSKAHGFCATGANYCVAVYAKDADAAFKTASTGINDRCVYLLDANGTSSECELSLNSFGPNQVVLNVDKAASTANLRIEVTLISCANVDVVPFATTAGLFGITNVSVTDTPHIMEFIFQPQAFVSAAVGTIYADADWGSALASYNGAAIAQGGQWRHELDGGFGGVTRNAAVIASSGVNLVQRVYTSSGSLVSGTRVALFTVSSSNVSVITTLDISPVRVLYGVMLSMNFGSEASAVGITTTPTSTGEAVISAAAKPQFMTWFATYLTTQIAAQAATTGTCSFGGADIDGRGESLGIRSQDNRSGTSIAKSWQRSHAYAIRQNNGPVDVEADFVEMLPTGTNLDWTNVSGSGRQLMYWWVEDFPYSAAEPLSYASRLGVASPIGELGVAGPRGILGNARPIAEAGVASPRATMGVAQPIAEQGTA